MSEITDPLGIVQDNNEIQALINEAGETIELTDETTHIIGKSKRCNFCYFNSNRKLYSGDKDQCHLDDKVIDAYNCYREIRTYINRLSSNYPYVGVQEKIWIRDKIIEYINEYYWWESNNNIMGQPNEVYNLKWDF